MTVGPILASSSRRPIGISYAFAQESMNYAKTRGVAYRNSSRTARDRFSRWPLKASRRHGLRVVQRCQPFCVFRAGRSIDPRNRGVTLAGGLMLPSGSRVAKILVIPGDRRPRISLHSSLAIEKRRFTNHSDERIETHI